MKRSWNADVKPKATRLIAFSVIALMGLMLSTSRAMAADDFKLWQLRPGKPKPVVLKPSTEEDHKKATTWLATDFSEKNLVSFVTSFRSEPFKFADGFKAAMLKSIETGKLDAFKQNIEKTLGKEDVRKAFGPAVREGAFKQLIEKMLGLSKEQLENPEFLKELFKDKALLGALGLIEEDPDKPKASPKPEASVSPKPENDEVQKAIDEMKKKMEAAEKDRKTLEEKLKEATKSPAPTNPPVPSTPPVPTVQPVPSGPPQPPPPPLPPVPTVRGPGEVPDALLQQQAQQVCDKMNAIRKAGDDNFNQLKDQINGLFNGLAELSRQPDRTQFNRKDKNELENLLPALLADSLKKDKNEQVAQAPQPQLQPTRSRNDDRNDKGIFDQQLPQRPEESPEPQQPFIPQALQSQGVTTPPRVDIPTSSGRVELRAVQDMNSALDPNMRTSALTNLSAQSPITDLVMAKANIQYDRNRGKVALTNAKDRLSKLDEQVEELKDGARSALDPNVKRTQAQLQADLDQKKRQYEQQSKQLQALAQQGGNGANNAGFAQAANQMAEEVSQAEQKLNKYNAEVEIAVEQGNKQIKALAKQRDKLQTETSQLEGYLSALKSEEDGVQALVNNQMQAQLAAIQGAQQPAGSPNVNKIMNGSGQRPPTSRLGGLGGAANAGAGGIPSRGSLAK